MLAWSYATIWVTEKNQNVYSKVSIYHFVYGVRKKKKKNLSLLRWCYPVGYTKQHMKGWFSWVVVECHKPWRNSWPLTQLLLCLLRPISVPWTDVSYTSWLLLMLAGRGKVDGIMSFSKSLIMFMFVEWCIQIVKFL